MTPLHSLVATPLILTSTAGTITLSKAVNGAVALHSPAQRGTTINGNIGASTPLAGLIITGAAVDFINANITTSGAQTYNDALTLSNIALT